MPEQVQFASVAGYGTKSRSAILEALMDVRYQCAYRDRSKDSFDESLVWGRVRCGKKVAGAIEVYRSLCCCRDSMNAVDECWQRPCFDT